MVHLKTMWSCPEILNRVLIIFLSYTIAGLVSLLKKDIRLWEEYQHLHDQTGGYLGMSPVMEFTGNVIQIQLGYLQATQWIHRMF